MTALSPIVISGGLPPSSTLGHQTPIQIHKTGLMVSADSVAQLRAELEQAYARWEELENVA